MSYLPPDKESRTWPRIFTGVAIALGVAALALAVATFVQVKFLTDAQVEAENTLAATKAKYEEVVVTQSEGSESTSVEVTESSDGLNSAYVQGKDLAELQTSAARLYKNKDKDVDAYTENVTSMKELLTDNAQKSGLAPWVNLVRDDIYWSFMSTYEFSGDSCLVVWELLDNSDKLYAYTTAMYQVDSGKFDDVKVYLTTAGEQALAEANKDSED